MSKTLAFIKKEFIEMLTPTIFFFVVFEIVLFARSLMGVEQQFSLTTTGGVVVAALIVGKSVLIADALPLFRWFRDPRLIINVFWRTLLYMLIVLMFQIIEELIPLLGKYDGLAAAASHLRDDIHWPRFWATHLIFAVFLVHYSFVTALISVIGGDRFREVFIGRSPDSR
jgi:hypothetical protein